MRDPRILNIGEGGIAIVKQVQRLAESLPVAEKYGLRSQICRSAVSIPSNIAEGCSRSSQVDFKRLLEIALGSSFELETQLIVIEELSIISAKETKVILGSVKQRTKDDKQSDQQAQGQQLKAND